MTWKCDCQQLVPAWFSAKKLEEKEALVYIVMVL